MSPILRRAGIKPHTVFKAFKYTIYTLLLWNVFLFFQEDLAASAQTFGDSITWRNVVEAYSATIDTAAWLVLLLLFELETAVIDDEKLKGNIKWLFTGVRGISYFFIIYAFYGYCYKYAVLNDLAPFRITDVCSLIGSDFTWVSDLDEYLPLNPQSCAVLQGQELLRVEGTSIIGSATAMQDALRLAIVDIVNAADWLVIVVLLEIEVYLQIRERLTDRMIRVGRWIKALLYGTLLVAAIYWGIEGDFLDFWDAFLWLVAFIFIEMNIFQWQEETDQQHRSGID
jgi:hypothetical protein